MEYYFVCCYSKFIKHLLKSCRVSSPGDFFRFFDKGLSVNLSGNSYFTIGIIIVNFAKIKSTYIDMLLKIILKL